MDGFAPELESGLAAVPELCRRTGVRTLDLFGSALTERFDPERSDLDFVVDFATPSEGGLNSPYFALLEGLESAFGRKVDLLDERTIQNPYLHRDVMATRRRIFPPTLVTNRVAKVLLDARNAIQEILELTRDKTFEWFVEQRVSRLAMERLLEILGESFVRVRRESPALAASLSDLPRVIAFRNIIAHRYDTLDNVIVWRTIKEDLPALLQRIEALLKEAP